MLANNGKQYACVLYAGVFFCYFSVGSLRQDTTLVGGYTKVYGRMIWYGLVCGGITSYAVVSFGIVFLY